MRMYLAFVVVVLSAAIASGKTNRTTAPIDYYRNLWVGTYDRGHHTDWRWDGPAHRALEAAAQEWRAANGLTEDEQDTFASASREAIDKGCDDPLLQYVCARGMAIAGASDGDISDLHAKAARGMAAENAPAILQFYADARASQYLRRGWFPRKHWADAGKFLQDAVALLPALANDLTVPRRQMVDAFDVLFQACRGLADTSWPKAYDAFAKSSKDLSLLLTIKGRYSRQMAWLVRGNGWADSVPAENMNAFMTDLADAHRSLAAAWDQDHSNFLAAQVMLSVELGEGNGAQFLRTWYSRATIPENPDVFEAARMTLWCMEPKWHGNIEQMLAFGRQCLAEGDWNRGVPLVLISAHLTASQYSPIGYQPNPQRGYFANNPQAFADVQAVYDEYLKRFPDSVYHRCRYAMLATWSGRWDIADRELKLLGDRQSSAWVMRYDTTVDELRQEVAWHLPHT